MSTLWNPRRPLDQPPGFGGIAQASPPSSTPAERIARAILIETGRARTVGSVPKMVKERMGRK